MIHDLIMGASAGVAGGLISMLVVKITLTKRVAHQIHADETIRNMLHGGEFLNASEILRLFDDFMEHRLVQKLPVLQMFIDEQLIKEIRTVFHEELEMQLPALIAKKSTAVELQRTASQLFSKIVSGNMIRLLTLIVLTSGIVGTALGLIVHSICVATQ